MGEPNDIKVGEQVELSLAAAKLEYRLILSKLGDSDMWTTSIVARCEDRLNYLGRIIANYVCKMETKNGHT